MTQDQFTKLFKYMQENFDRIDQRLDETMSKQDGDRLYELLDGIAHRLDVESSERAAHAAQLDRHQDSIDHHDQSLGKLDRRVSGLEARAVS